MGSAQRFVCAAALGVAVVLAAMPARAATPAPALPAEPASAASRAPSKKTPVAPIDINSASPAQLKTLPGIGDKEASRIVAGRPYLSKADLASKGVLPTGVYLSLKNRIIARQRQEPKRKQ